MENSNQNLAHKVSYISLIGSLSLVLFAFLSAILGFVFSFVVYQLGFKSRLLDLPFYQNLSFLTLAVLLIMGLCLFYSQRWLSPRIEEVKESVGEKLLTVLAVILSIVLLLLFYFGYANFLSFLFNRFWA